MATCRGLHPSYFATGRVLWLPPPSCLPLLIGGPLASGFFSALFPTRGRERFSAIPIKTPTSCSPDGPYLLVLVAVLMSVALPNSLSRHPPQNKRHNFKPHCIPCNNTRTTNTIPPYPSQCQRDLSPNHEQCFHQSNQPAQRISPSKSPSSTNQNFAMPCPKHPTLSCGTPRQASPSRTIKQDFHGTLHSPPCHLDAKGISQG